MRHVSLNRPDLQVDPDDPAGFRAAMFRFGKQLGAERTGASLYELPPGEAVCPYHYEDDEEEWMLVLSGNPTVRDPEGEHRLEPMDVVFFACGPEGAHQVRNDGDEPVRVLMWSENRYPGVTTYPDSGKIGVWPRADHEGRLYRIGTELDYYDGESNDQR
jgi:uncharacterized cupin superfamily protein